MPKFEVIHPVFTGKTHPRGSSVILSEADGAQLQALGYLGAKTEVDNQEERNVGTAALGAMTKSQLIAYATDNFDLELNTAQNKAQMIEAIELAEEAKLEVAKGAS
jgi:hypothetical protein